MITLRRIFTVLAPLGVLFFVCSCVRTEYDEDAPDSGGKNVGFNVRVTREGQSIEEGRQGIVTRAADASHSASGSISTMDKSIPFGLVGVDFDHNALVVDNAKVPSDGSGYKTFLSALYWDQVRSETISFSAYYPYVNALIYGDDHSEYTIPYAVEDTDAGPLVSKTVDVPVSNMDLIPLEFQHITNDIGYRICDITPDKDLQGLVHLRKLTAFNVATAGVFVNDMARNRGVWRMQRYYRDVVVFEGDAKVGVGSAAERFVSFSTLESRMAQSHRYYSIPDEIQMGKQYVEVIFDVEGFTLNDFTYPPIQGVSIRYPLYGLLPDNEFVYGRQYTFHIGIDLSSIYQEITFSPQLPGWGTKIYENNDSF